MHFFTKQNFQIIGGFLFLFLFTGSFHTAFEKIQYKKEVFFTILLNEKSFSPEKNQEKSLDFSKTFVGILKSPTFFENLKVNSYRKKGQNFAIEIFSNKKINYEKEVLQKIQKKLLEINKLSGFNFILKEYYKNDEIIDLRNFLLLFYGFLGLFLSFLFIFLANISKGKLFFLNQIHFFDISKIKFLKENDENDEKLLKFLKEKGGILFTLNFFYPDFIEINEKNFEKIYQKKGKNNILLIKYFETELKTFQRIVEILEEKDLKIFLIK